MLSIDSYDKATRVEYESVRVTTGNETEWSTINVLVIKNVKKNDLIQIYLEGQARNDLGYNIEIVTALQMDDKFDSNMKQLSGFYQSNINGYNFNTTTHYARYSKSDIYMFQQDYPIVYLQSKIRFRSTDAKINDYVIVNKSQGHMYYLKFRQHT